MFHWVELTDRTLVCLETGGRLSRSRDGIVRLMNGILSNGMNIEQVIYIPANEHDAQIYWEELKTKLGVK